MALHISLRPPTSVQLDIAAVLEDLGPARRLAANKRVELGGRAAGGRENPHFLQFGAHRRIGVDARDFAMDFVDDGGSTAGRGPPPRPAGAFLSPPPG